MSEENNKWKCGCSKEQLQKELVETEDWEVKKKEKLKEILTSDNAPYWYCNGEKGEKHYLTNYPKPWGSFGTSFIQCSLGCGNIGKKTNEFMDELEIEHECEIKSNQIKSNQIKSNQIKSNQSQSIENDKPKNYLPWILVGIGLVILVGILVYFWTRKNKELKEND